MWEPKLRTPGMDRSSRLPRSTIRTSSGWEVPGAVTQCIRKSRSLKVGNRDSPSEGTTAIPAATTTATVAYAHRGRITTLDSAAV